MAKIDLVTSNETGIFNADPCPNPDNPANDIGSDGIFLKCYGLPAPFPTFVLPQYRRDSTMTDPTNSKIESISPSSRLRFMYKRRWR